MRNFFVASLLLAIPFGVVWAEIDLDEMGIIVPSGESREVVFTNKEAAHFTTESSREPTRSYHGLTVSMHEFIDGWTFVLGDEVISSEDVVRTVVYPDRMVREYGNMREEIFLTDFLNALLVTLSTAYRGRAALIPRIDIRFIWEVIKTPYTVEWVPEENLLLISSGRHPRRTQAEDYPVWVGIGCDRPLRFIEDGLYIPTVYPKSQRRRAMAISTPFQPGRLEFTLESQWARLAMVVADTREEAVDLFRFVLKEEDALRERKRARFKELLSLSRFVSDDDELDLALRWAKVSLDNLIMNQRGRGIYAGLHWFPTYWGRDTFISLPGAALVTGNFQTARELLLSFAAYQNRDENQLFYGRIPNIVTPTEVKYNTADGTGWFVREAWEYVKYSGDVEFAREIFDVVETAIEGTMDKRMDEEGFVLHGDAETWMDAGGDLHSYSPRGNRAVEIQALWFAELESGASLADLIGRPDLAHSWRTLARRVRRDFVRRFWNRDIGGLYDHLNPDAEPDEKIRPNQLFALTVPWRSLLTAAREATVATLVREKLAYPHGVGSLDPDDPNFHPWHLHLSRYHYDEAYHNGDVWLWLTGPMVSSLVRHGQVETAYRLTQDLTDHVLRKGAVGTLSELQNAVPILEADNEVGTITQAWSLAEFIRNLHQDYLGLRPDAVGRIIEVEPALPAHLSQVEHEFRVANARVKARYDMEDGREYSFYSDDIPEGYRVRLGIRVPGGKRLWVDEELARGRWLNIEVELEEGEGWDVSVNGDPGSFSVERTIFDLANDTVAQLRIPEIPARYRKAEHDTKQLSAEGITAVNPHASVLLVVSDPSGDDVGDGDYTYPTDSHFRPGMFDLTGFQVSVDSGVVYFEISYRDLVDPGWHPEYGYQLTYTAVAIDTDPGSGGRSFGKAANAQVSGDAAYERIIYIGGGIEVQDARGEVLALYTPLVVDDRFGHPEEDRIRFALSTSLLGTPQAGWGFTVICGGQEDFGQGGLGQFREVGEVASQWRGGGGVDSDLNPNVYDILVPEGVDQREVLSNYRLTGEAVVVPTVRSHGP